MRLVRSIVPGLVGLLAACKGGGSDIGPKLQPYPGADYAVVVQDDQGRPVAAAKVTIAGLAEFATTNRWGRARIPTRPSGTRVLTVDGTAAAAAAKDRLGVVSIAAQMPGRDEFPFVVTLPDTASSAGATLDAGVQGVARTLDDRATSGALLTLDAGSSVTAGTAAKITLRTAGLAPEHLPQALPAPASGAWTTGRGVYVDPPEARFQPGASLSLPNELGLSAGASATLFHLDTAGGTWSAVGVGTVDGAGARIEAGPGSVVEGGLYVFATPVAATTVLSGRVVRPTGEAVEGVLVKTAQAHARTTGDGRFTLPPVAAVDASGAARNVVLELHAGRDLAPARATTSTTAVAGVSDLGDLTLDTRAAGTVRVLLVTRGRADPRRPLAISSAEGLGRGIGISDGGGKVTFEEIEKGWLGGVTSRFRPEDVSRIFRAEAIAFFGGGRVLDLLVFGSETNLWDGRSRSGDTIATVVDREGTGPIRFADVVRGVEPEKGHVGETSEAGRVIANFDGAATAVMRTQNAERTVISAFTMHGVDSTRIELPLERAPRLAQGAFDRHGIVEGALLSSAGATLRRVRATRWLTREDWFEEVFEGRSVSGDVPLDEDPERSGAPSYSIGVPAPAGHLAAIAGTSAGGVVTVQRAGFAADVAPVEGERTALDLNLDLVADTSFLVRGARAGLHPWLTTMSFDWAVERSDGVLVDMARGIGGNMAAAGVDVTFTLPALAGRLAGGRHLLVLRGEATQAGKSVRQREFLELTGSATEVEGMLGVPDITAPAPGATVSSGGFTVNFTVPAGAFYTVVELRSETASETRSWRAVLPPQETSFTFVKLPEQAPQVLAAGRAWTLAVTAARIGRGPLRSFQDPYRRVLVNWVGIRAGERGVDATSTTSIPVTTN